MIRTIESTSNNGRWCMLLSDTVRQASSQEDLGTRFCCCSKQQQCVSSDNIPGCLWSARFPVVTAM